MEELNYTQTYNGEIYLKIREGSRLHNMLSYLWQEERKNSPDVTPHDIIRSLVEVTYNYIKTK